jgi:thymidylate synthase ThyX
MSARDILASITAEEADKFNDKWVIGYGHSSVAELATVPVCIEGLSIVASKVVETMQRAAFSEKSTRYQKFSSESFVTPPGAPDTMKAFAKRLYATYDQLQEPMAKRCAILMGRDPNDPKAIDKVVRARVFDNLRYLLPAGTGTNVACVINLRDARDSVSTLLGHTNPELKQIGEDILLAVSNMCPVLMRHASPNTFEPAVRSLGPLGEQFDPRNPKWCVSVLPSNTQGVFDTFAKAVEHRYGMDWETFSKHMDARPEHLPVPKIFDTVPISFDMVMDYGAFRDLQRHRKCEQFVEPLTTQYGFAIPDDIAGSELEHKYVSAMNSVTSYADDVMNDPDLSQYIIPLGYLHRSVFQMSLKELYYLVELRTRPHGHMSYRRVAHKMCILAAERHPKLMQWCRVVEPIAHGAHT